MTTGAHHAPSEHGGGNVIPLRPGNGQGTAEDLTQFDGDAEHDQLTGLLGNRPFQGAVRGAAQRRRGSENPWVAAAALEGIAEVVAEYGLAARAQLLRVMSKRLADSMREGDKMARIGESLFGVIVDAPTGEEAMAAFERMVAAVRAQAKADARWSDVRLTVGVAMLWGEEPYEAMAMAREALLRARERGGDIVMMSTSVR